MLLFLAGSYGTYLIIGMSMDSIDTTENITVDTKETIEVVAEKDDSVLIFYSSSCPHCEVVEKYLASNRSTIKANVKSLKIDNPKTDKSNIELALAKIKECKLKDNWGVPLMYHNGDCLMGDQPIIDYLNQIK